MKSEVKDLIQETAERAGEPSRSPVQHTPGPWMTDEACLPGGVYCDDATGSLVARCFGKGFESIGRSKPEALANAALIVRAVNSHADLIAALEAADRQTYCDCPQHDGAHTNHEPDCYMPLLRAALAKAGASS